MRIESDEDDRQLAQVPLAELNEIISHEVQLAHDPNIRAHGQMLHFIARRTNAT